MGPLDRSVKPAGAGATAPKEFNIGSIMNYGSMAAGIAQNAMAKKPALVKPIKYKSFIRPARGNEDATQRGLNAIEQEGSKATRDINTNTGSSLSANTAGRLGIMDRLIKSKSDVLGKNAEVQRNDQMRVDGQINQDLQMNTAQENQFNLQNNDREYREWAQRKAAGNASIQSAINYGTEKAADMTNKSIAERQANQGIGMKGQAAVDAERNTYIMRGQEHLFTPEREQAIRDAYSKYETENYPKREKGGIIKKFKSGGSMKKLKYRKKKC